jgi:hypothetical protein
MFGHNRIYSNRSATSGQMEWFFETREGVQGPFATEQHARTALDRHIEYAKRNQLDGGRKLGLIVPNDLELGD